MKQTATLLLFALGTALGQAVEPAKLKLHWAKNYLTIRRDHLPGGEMKIHYLEAYCRANSQTTDWSKHTVVGHKTRLVSRSADSSQLKLHCVVSDGVTVEYVITATHDEVVSLTHNPQPNALRRTGHSPAFGSGNLPAPVRTPPGQVRLHQKELHLSRWQTCHDADTRLGHRGPLHSRSGLGGAGRAAQTSTRGRCTLPCPATA